MNDNLKELLDKTSQAFTQTLLFLVLSFVWQIFAVYFVIGYFYFIPIKYIVGIFFVRSLLSIVSSSIYNSYILPQFDLVEISKIKLPEDKEDKKDD